MFNTLAQKSYNYHSSELYKYERLSPKVEIIDNDSIVVPTLLLIQSHSLNNIFHAFVLYFVCILSSAVGVENVSLIATVH